MRPILQKAQRAPVPVLYRGTQQLRQLGDIGGDAPGLVAGKHVGGQTG